VASSNAQRVAYLRAGGGCPDIMFSISGSGANTSDSNHTRIPGIPVRMNAAGNQRGQKNKNMVLVIGAEGSAYSLEGIRRYANREGKRHES